MFNFFDDEDNSGYKQRSHKQRRPHRRRNPPVEDEDETDQDIDDAVDDGFFSRYVKEAENGRVFNVSKLDAEPREEFKSSNLDHQTAARAFDAVDRLFGSINAQKDKGASGSSTTDDKFDKSSWLDDIKARAATSGERDTAAAVDVQAVDESQSLDERVMDDDFAEAGISPDPSEYSRSKSQNREKGSARGNEGSEHSSTFQTFMNFARKGPTTDREEDTREKDSRREKNAREDIRGRPRRPPPSSVLNLGRFGERDSTDNYEPLDDEMEAEIEFGSKPKRRSGRRQRYTAVRRVGGRTRRILNPPLEWQPMDQDEVGQVRSENRPLGGRGPRKSQLQGVIADCQSCRGAGTETCAICLGSGWVAPLNEPSGKEKTGRRELLEEFWSRPNLVVDIHGNAQCVRCNGIGKQFCGSCQGSGSALRKGFSLSERYEVFDMFPSVSDDAVVDGDEEYDELEEEDEVENEFESFQLYQGSADLFNLSTGKGRTGGEESKLQEDDDDVLDVGDDEDAVVMNVEDDDEDMDDVADESEELLAGLESMDLGEEKGRTRGEGMFTELEKSEGLLEDDDDIDEDLDFEVEDEYEESDEGDGLYDLELEEDEYDDGFEEGSSDVGLDPEGVADSDDDDGFGFDEEDEEDEEEEDVVG